MIKDVIFFDIDTQNDFFNSYGALPVPDAQAIRRNLGLLTAFALYHGIIVLGSVDIHHGTLEYKEKERELSKWGGQFPDHCIVGSYGACKIQETKIHQNDSYIYTNITTPVTAIDLIQQYHTVYFKKHSTDIFYSATNPGGNMIIEDIMQVLAPKLVICYGVATDYCVKHVVLGMLRLGINVNIIEDAIAGLDNSKKAIQEMYSSGARFTTTKEYIYHQGNK